MTVAPRPLSLPPLFWEEAAPPGMDPLERAQAQAALGCDAGLVVHRITADHLAAAIVFAPEVPLAQAAAMLVTCGIGFSNALGALAPPEVAVHLEWDGALRVNGARCGRLRMAATTTDPSVVPDWLIVALDVPLIPGDADAPGLTPDETSLFEEGCVEVDPSDLLASWTRHTLVWINRWLDEGTAPLAANWRGMVHGTGEATTQTLNGTALSGTFLGVDEDFGMLLRDDRETHLIPLTSLLE